MREDGAVQVGTPRQRRVVRQDGPGSDEDGVALLAKAHPVGPSLLSGDPPALAGRSPDLPVERRGPLEVDERTPRADRDEERLVEPLGALREGARLGGDSGGAEPFPALPRRPRVGVERGEDDAGDTGLDERPGAGRRPPLVGARLQVQDDGRAPGSASRLREGDDLGVRPARPLVPALSDDLSSRGDDDGADARVRRRRIAPLLGELEDPLEGGGEVSHR